MNWDEYYLGLAKQASMKSKDPSTKVGAIVVDNNNRIVSTGYNGFPVGVLEPKERWERPLKYEFVCHAELNALIYSGFTLDGTLYCTHYPCSNCGKYIIQAGIKRIVIPKQEKKDPESSVGKTQDLAETMFSEVGISVTEI